MHVNRSFLDLASQSIHGRTKSRSGVRGEILDSSEGKTRETFQHKEWSRPIKATRHAHRTRPQHDVPGYSQSEGDKAEAMGPYRICVFTKSCVPAIVSLI
jgi:hypothetical protein